jgi:hypothetical protein
MQAAKEENKKLPVSVTLAVTLRKLKSLYLLMRAAYYGLR